MNPTIARIIAPGLPFAEAVEAACEYHEQCNLGVATICYVNEGEPDIVDDVDHVSIIPCPIVPLSQFWASRAAA